MAAKALPSVEVLRERFTYDPHTGVLIWNRLPDTFPRAKRYIKAFNSLFAGTVAGNARISSNGYGYVQIYIEGKNYKAHRLIWKLMTGEEPDGIDHIDRNGINNTWANLRAVSQSLNCRNMSQRKDNTSGITGVHWSARRNKWIAQARAGSVSFAAYYDTLEEADFAVKAFRAEHCFTEMHGTPRKRRIR